MRKNNLFLFTARALVVLTWLDHYSVNGWRCDCKCGIERLRHSAAIGRLQACGCVLAIGNVLQSGGEAALSRAAAGMRVHGWMPSGETDASVRLRACGCGRVTATSCCGELHARVWWRAEMRGDGCKGAATLNAKHKGYK